MHSVEPGAVLLHEEHGTQGVWTATHRRVKNMRNRQEFLERWGPKLIRSVRLAGLGAEDPAWLSRPPLRAVVGHPEAREVRLGDRGRERLDPHRLPA